jgi:uncharacterized membrane protein YgcG
MPVLSAILASVLDFGGALTLQTSPAAAYDPDVEVVCFDYEGADGSSETECQTIEELTAECAVADPEYTTDVCQGLLESRRPLGLTTTTGTQRDDNRDDNRDKGDRGRDRDSGGNDGGGSDGGNDGGGNSGGRDGGRGGSGPNG